MARNDTEKQALVRRDDTPLDWFLPRSLAREFDEMRNRMVRLFSGFGMTPSAFISAPEDFNVSGIRPLELYETKDELRMTADVAGFDEKDLDISVTSDTVTIAGHHQEEHEKEEGEYHWKHASRGSFRRSFRLPVEVDPDRTRATIKNGLLKITMPKTHVLKAKPVKIEAEDKIE